MSPTYRSFFGLEKEPFGADLDLDDILKTDELNGVVRRFDYAVRIGAVAVVTGEIGSGKSTALRYAGARLHRAEYKCFYVLATSGSIMELYRQIAAEMGLVRSSNSKAVMTNLIRSQIVNLALDKKIKAVLTIDEASLLRLEVLAELHTLCQYEKDSKHFLPVVLAGQSNLIDKLTYRSSEPLASRVVARSHLQGPDLEGMHHYISHHLRLAGVKANLFEEAAVTAIHQGSGGLLRKANHLARGALMAAAGQNATTVSAEHVRLAATELF
jgi:type II secretory pathway predicted ATPase ExeA